MNKAANDTKAIRSKSTSTEAQRARLIALLRIGPHDTFSLRKYGLMQVSARIWGLRDEGYEISTERITAYDSEGYPHAGVARYTLIREPDQQDDLPTVVEMASNGP